MKHSSLLAWFAGVTYAGCAIAQAPALSISAEVTAAYTAVKTNILRTADRMPDANYSFQPMPDVRGFADVLDHIADSQMRTCSAVAGDQKSPNAAGRKSKTEVTSALADAFAECDRAYGSLSDANAGDAVTTAHGQRSKLGLLTGNIAHDSEQYGILTMYLRLQRIVPPSTEEHAGH